jgi:hypothetical protein
MLNSLMPHFRVFLAVVAILLLCLAPVVAFL